MRSFSITHGRTALPAIPFSRIKNNVLGNKHVVSLVFVGTTRARTLNMRYRKKSYVPNVLSFPLDEQTGEIYICTPRLVREAPKYNMSVRTYTGYLFIHALLHLKGRLHGATMETIERELLSRFVDFKKPHATKNSHRN